MNVDSMDARFDFDGACVRKVIVTASGIYEKVLLALPEKYDPIRRSSDIGRLHITR